MTRLTSTPAKTEIKVVDARMGSGKSSWAIQYMNEAPVRQKFIYITPLTGEMTRIIDGCPNRNFVQPSDKNGTKTEYIKRLIADGADIASSHSLFKRMDAEMLELIEIEDYTLILDEVMNVVEQVKIPTADLKMLHSRGIIEVDDKGIVHWTDDDYDDGYFVKIRNLANAGNLMMYEDEEGQPVAVYWMFPREAFKSFNEVYLLTYLFHGQIQRAYFDLFKLDYKYCSVANSIGRYQLSDYVPYHKEYRKDIKELINIYYPSPNDKKDMNKVGNKTHDFSVGNLEKRSKQSEVKKVIKDNAYNFYRHKCKVSPDEAMWTTFLGDGRMKLKDALTPKGLKDNSETIDTKNQRFVEVTCRATNEYKEKSTCIYLANRFMNPVTINFFASNGVTVDEDMFALSELLQWLFRSRIREGKAINLYIPSKRMRTLLERYLDNEL
jgi:hypothetical protein